MCGAGRGREGVPSILAAMALTWPLVLAVLAGALMHAGWNALVKSSTDKTLDTALLHAIAAALTWPLALLLGPPPAQAWPFLAASLTLHIGYYFALAGAYQHGELGLTYPIMRGLAPLLVAVASATVLGETLGPGAWAGVLAIAFGVALVGLSRPAAALQQHKAMAFALANAAIIAAYTLVDGRGVRESGDALRYTVWLFALDGLPYPLLVLWHRGAQARPQIAAYVRGRWKLALIGGAASLGSYAIALWAMTRAPVASVAALRETSVLFAALIGTLWLGERFGLQRALGTLAIVGGVIALRLG